MPCASPAFNGHLVLIRTGPRRWGEARRHPGKEELHHAAHVVGFDATLSGGRWRCGAGRARSNGRNVLKCNDPPMTNFSSFFPSNYNHHKCILYINIYNSCYIYIYSCYIYIMCRCWMNCLDLTVTSLKWWLGLGHHSYTAASFSQFISFRLVNADRFSQ